MKILIFGGTGEGRELANRLVEMGHDVTTSLAGRTTSPLRPAGKVRVGGFGGTVPLVAFLLETRPDFVVDATHPYARTMPGTIAAAAQQAGIRFLRLQRPEWSPPGGVEWQMHDKVTDAIHALPDGAAALVTTGHEAIAAMIARADCRFVVRLIERPEMALPPHVTLILDRPPFTRESEVALMQEEDITHLVTKNSGGAQTRAKIDAAAELGIDILMVRRPVLPAMRAIDSVEEALTVLQEARS